MKSIPVRHITKGAKESGKFNIRDVKVLLGGKDLHQELHRHDFFFLLALQKGKGTHEIDFVTHNLSDNSVFFMRPGQVHQLTLKSGCTGYLMEFNTEFYHPNNKPSNQRLRRASNKNICKLDTSRFNKINTLLNYIFQEYSTKEEGHQDAIRANLDILFIELIRQSQNSKSLTKDENPYAQERLEEFLELLSEHINDHKQVSQFADMMKLSTYQLNEITKATVGKTSSELLNEHIILEARRNILATSNQIKDIAYQLGYEDVSYFIRFFKKHTGQSPEAFRRNSE